MSAAATRAVALRAMAWATRVAEGDLLGHRAD
jgi:hypothetical protein